MVVIHMRANLDKRLRLLEEGSRPPIIATLADFVLWQAHGRPRPIEFDPVVEKIFRDAIAKREARDGTIERKLNPLSTNLASLKT